MRIIDKRECKTKQFGTLYIGDTFIAEGDVYIKVDEISDADYGIKTNAVCLEDGTYAFFYENNEVETIRAEIVIN